MKIQVIFCVEKVSSDVISCLKGLIIAL